MLCFMQYDRLQLHVLIYLVLCTYILMCAGHAAAHGQEIDNSSIHAIHGLPVEICY